MKFATQASYVYVDATDQWEIVQQDRAPKLIYRWIPAFESTIAAEPPAATLAIQLS